MAAAGADVRGRVLEAISRKPGIHMRELQRTIGISLSGISHHVRALEKQGVVIGISDRHYRRYFSSNLLLPREARLLNEADRRLLAECRRPASLTIVLNLAVDGPMDPGEIRVRLKRSHGTVRYHLSRLVDTGVVNIRRGSAGEMYELVERDRVISILATFSDTLRDHADGFARLWLDLREW